MLRTILYLFVIVDIHLIVRDPIPLSRHPELYRPLLLERLLHLPPPSVPLTVTLYAVIMVGSLVAAGNWLPRIAGWVVAAAFTWWTAIGMSYGKVDHDHLALVVALWVLPTAGAVAGRWRSTVRSAQAGWALQVHPDRRGLHLLPVGAHQDPQRWLERDQLAGELDPALGDHPPAERAGPVPGPVPGAAAVDAVGGLLAELSSLVVLWLRGRALLLAALFWLSFHLFTVTILYIHFAPTLICWLAFAPLERRLPSRTDGCPSDRSA